MKKYEIPQSNSSLTAWLYYIESLHGSPIDMGLNRIVQVAERLDLLKSAPFVFTVAGTNGKGTTCCVLESILIAAGYKVGVYSSPHLIRYTERGRVQKNELSESAYVTSFSEIESIRGNVSLTYFEYSTLSVLWLFEQVKLDVIILEVGLGGRLDATNVIDTDVAVITNVALDHTYWLGSNRESIGREKAGIFRTGKPAVIGELNTPHTISTVAKKKGAHLLRYGFDWQYKVTKDSWYFSDIQGQIDNLPLPQVPQPNAATALAALRASKLTIDHQAIYDGIKNANLPGRFQIIKELPRVILDVAHNPHAVSYLAERLMLLPKIGRILAVVGILKDKDINSMLSFMKKVVDKWYCASLDGPRGTSAKHLIKYLDQGYPFSNVELAWTSAMADARLEDTILVYGSFQTVARVMELMKLKG